MKRTIIIIVVGVLWTSTAFSQYFSKTFFTEDNLLNIGIWQVNTQIPDRILINADHKCNNEYDLCMVLMSTDNNGNVLVNNERELLKGFRNTMKVRNDTIFYSGSYFSQKDSITYWYFGLTNLKGESLGGYKYPILHINDTGRTGLGYQTPTNYGLTLVNNNEVILWGEGLDKRMPQPSPPADEVPYRSAFLRVGIDGERKSDLFWFEMSEYPLRRMSDAATDIDGNMVFVYEWAYPFVSIEINRLRRGLFKILPDNSIDTVAEYPIADLGRGDPKMAIDSQGNYIINPVFRGGGSEEYNVRYSDVGFLSKINRAGEVLWTSIVPPAFRNDPTKHLYSTNTYQMYRISTTRNGDILCSGRVFVADSFAIPGLPRKKYISGNGSYIARFNGDGKLLWQHFIVPLKKDTTIRFNAVLDIKEAPDGSIVVGGRLEKSDAAWKNDAWLMKLTPGGCLDADCSHVVGKYWVFPEDISAVQDEPMHRLQSVTVSPNPGRDRVRVRLSADAVYPLHYEVQSVTGIRHITGTMTTASDTDIDMDWLPSGMYIIYIRDKAGQTGSVKWVRE